MRLEGIHHVTAITAQAQANVDFYADVLGLRFVKKTVNFDQPDAYHLYYGDETGAPGSIMTFFEFPGVPPGTPGPGNVHTVIWRVGSAAALDWWGARLTAAGLLVRREDGVVRIDGPEGLGIELISAAGPDTPLRAEHAGVPAEHALRGLHGVRAHADVPGRSTGLLEALGFDQEDGGWSLAGEDRRATFGYDRPPDQRGLQGAGSVHHVAWAARDDELTAWGEAVAAAGARPTPVIDRTYFRSIYFREPSGVLFEIATLGPGFAVDEPADRLGEALVLPPQHERLRPQLEARLTPLTNPRAPA